MDVWDIFQMITALVVIVFLANFLLKKLNGLQQPSSQVIKIIERVQVSKSSSLCIVQVESEYMLMSISERSNEVIKTFTDEEKEAIQQRLAKKQHSHEAGQLTSQVAAFSNDRAASLTTYIKKWKKQYAEFQKKGINKT
jgi:flagellar protein FliO/FliZ